MSKLSVVNTVNVEEKLKELKNLINDEKLETRMDDLFLIRFLKLKLFDVKSSFIKIKTYEEFRLRNKENFLHVEREKLKHILQSKVFDILHDEDLSNNSVILIRPGLWDTSKFNADEILKLAGLIAETIFADIKQDAISVVLVFDMHNFSMKHIYGLSTNFAKKMVQYLAECVPIYIDSLYIVRESKIFSIIYSCFKPFLDDRMRSKISFCGQNLEPLKERIRANILPVELGGLHEDISPERWLKLIDADHVQKELSKAGYIFKD